MSGTGKLDRPLRSDDGRLDFVANIVTVALSLRQSFYTSYTVCLASEYISNIMMSCIVPVIATYITAYYIGYWVQQRILY